MPLHQVGIGQQFLRGTFVLYLAVVQHDHPLAVVEDQVEIAIQVMGKIRARINAPAGLDAAGLEEFARDDPAVIEALDGLTVRKVIAVPESLVNFVAN